jgi:photosystem II stability/assembly factor-like uncharacterized protein
VVVALLVLPGCAVRVDFPSPAEASLVAEGDKVIVQSLHCFSTGEVIATGIKDAFTNVDGVVFLSEDRGETWRRIPLGAQAVGIPLSLLSLPGAQEGPLYASGYREGANFLSSVMTFRFEPGPWWVTRDKGRTWHQTEPRLPLLPTTVIMEKLPKIERADEAGTLIGVVEEQRQLVVLRSSDGGTSWSRQTLAKLEHYGSLISDGRGQVAVTGRATRNEHGVVYLSTDGGAIWEEVRPVGIDLLDALRLYRTPNGALIAYNNDELHRSGYRTVISQSVDGGRTWGPARTFPGLGRIVGTAGDAKGRVVAITSRGAVLHSKDDGGLWRVVHSAKPGTRVESSNVILSNDGAALATLDRGYFFRSADGGETWQAVDSRLPDRQYVLDAHCTDGEGLIVVGGSGGMVTRSTDWGATWQRGRLLPPGP